MEIVGVDKNWVHDFQIGIAGGITFILLNILSAGEITIGIPRPSVIPLIALTYSFVGTMLTIVFLAPILEEALFRMVGWSVGTGFLGTSMNAKIATAIVTAAVFSIFHYTSYGLSMSASFFGAGLFGLLAVGLMQYTNSQISNIVLHFCINGFLFLKLYGYMSFGIG